MKFVARLITLGLVCSGLATAQDGRQVTFNHDLAPIVFENCASCHRSGESAPFSLLTYEDVKTHARQIAAVTRSRYMPPWLPAPGALHFDGERRLTDTQIALFRRWIDDGLKEGKAADLPPVPKFTEGWQLGQPDMILEAQKPFLLTASGTDVYWNFIFPVPVDRTRWLAGLEIRPGNKRVVHHANILVDRLESARHMEGSPGAGFGGMELQIESEAFDPDSHLLFWKPGTVPRLEPDGMSLRIDKGTDLVLNVHLQPSGKPEWIRPSLGLYFTDKPATVHPMLLEIENDQALNIPAGATNFIVTDSLRLPIAVDLMAVYPHAHYLATDMLATASFPDGKTIPLIHIPHWDLNWQAVYRYARPVPLPAGTTVTMRYVYNNSEQNIANPNHPPKRVEGGNRATDEMAHFWLQVLPHTIPGSDRDPRMVLQEALSQHEVDKNPASFEAQYNLASMLRYRGDDAAALDHYEAALKLRPADPIVNNALGSALLAAGEAAAAIPHFRQALAARSDYFDAHYNLGIALASINDFGGAAGQFQESARLHPADANAHANLGAALAQLGHVAEAKAEFKAALRIDPHNEIARGDLTALQQ